MVFILLIPLNFKVGGGEDWESFCIRVDCSHSECPLCIEFGTCIGFKGYVCRCEGEGRVFIIRKPYKITEHTPGLLSQFGSWLVDSAKGVGSSLLNTTVSLLGAAQGAPANPRPFGRRRRKRGDPRGPVSKSLKKVEIFPTRSDTLLKV